MKRSGRTLLHGMAFSLSLLSLNLSAIENTAPIPSEAYLPVLNSFTREDNLAELQASIDRQLEATTKSLQETKNNLENHGGLTGRIRRLFDSSATPSLDDQLSQWQALQTNWQQLHSTGGIGSRGSSAAADTDERNTFSQQVTDRYQTLIQHLNQIQSTENREDQIIAINAAQTLINQWQAVRQQPFVYDLTENGFSRAPAYVAEATAAEPISTSDELLTQCYEGNDNRNAQDLAATNEAVIDERIKALAKQLNHSPKQILEYVTNNIEFEPRPGITKDAPTTLLAGKGNAMEHASLLIALLRASGYPARYVKGEIYLEATKSHIWWLKLANFQVARKLLDTFTLYAGAGETFRHIQSIAMNHVWVETCLPYGKDRGQSETADSYRWLALDSSFKYRNYIPATKKHNLTFDFEKYVSKRTIKTPLEFYQNAVLAALRAEDPNVTLDQVMDRWELIPLKLEALPTTLPYKVKRFTQWQGTNQSTIAAIPDAYRLKLTVSLNDTKLATVNLIDMARSRLTLSFAGINADAQKRLDNWRAGKGGALACPTNLTVKPVLNVYGKPIALANQPQLNLCEESNFTYAKLKLENETQEGVFVTKEFDGITLLDVYALQGYARQASDKMVQARVKNLLTNIFKYQSEPWKHMDAVLGDFLDVVLLKYMHYVERESEAIATLANGLYNGQYHTALTRSRADIKYLFDLPYAINSDNFIIDAPGIGSNPIDNQFGQLNKNIFHATGAASSFYESYIWQETILRETLSTVSAMQYSAGQGNKVIKIDQQFDLASIIDSSVIKSCLKCFWVLRCEIFSGHGQIFLFPKLSRREEGGNISCPACVNYYREKPCYDVRQLHYFYEIAQNPGNVVYLNKTAVDYKGFYGAAFARLSAKEAQFAIGPYDGGYTLRPPSPPPRPPSWNVNVNWNINRYNPDSGFGLNAVTILASSLSVDNNYGVESALNTFNKTLDILHTVNSVVSLGGNVLSTWAGDPVNMVTGNMYHHETDLNLPARGMPVVFKRSYNSLAREDGPLGYGWTHSFNHYLLFLDDDENGKVDTIVWSDGMDGKKFINVPTTAFRSDGTIELAPGVAGIPDGYYFTFIRRKYRNDAQYVLTEKNGLAYYFSNVAGKAGEVAQLVAIADRHGNKLTLQYKENRLNTVTDPDGRQLTFTYNNQKRLSVLKDWTGNEHRYQYNDKTGELTAYYNPLSGDEPATIYAYYGKEDGPYLHHAMKSFTYANGYQMTFEYYANGKVSRHYNAVGNTAHFAYNPFRRESVFTNERGHTEHYFFNKDGMRIKTIDHNGGVHEYKYENPNNPYLMTHYYNPMGYLTQYEYDEQGNNTKTILPSGVLVENFEHNALGQPGLIKNAAGHYQRHVYDQHGNVTDLVTFKSSAASLVHNTPFNPEAPGVYSSHILNWDRNVYYPNGTLKISRKVRDFTQPESGPYSLYQYEDQVNKVTGAYPVTVQHFGDKNGDGVIADDEFDGPFTLEYDKRGKLVKGYDEAYYPLHSEYNQIGQLTRSKDRFGNWWYYSYDKSGLPLGDSLMLMGEENSQPSVADQTVHQYSKANRLKATYNHAGATVRFEHDATGNIVKTTNPDGYTVHYEYDASNRLIKTIDPSGRVSETRYDVLNRVLWEKQPDGVTTNYAYYGAEQNGLLKTIIRPNIALKDKDNNLLPLRETHFEYDKLGQVIKVTDSAGRTTLTDYDELGRAVRVVQPVYDDDLLKQVRPVTHHHYDSLGRLVTVYAGHTSAAGDRSQDNVKLQMMYTYDDFGRMLSKTDALKNTWQFTYNERGQIQTTTDAKGQQSSYSYYPSGLLKSEEHQSAENEDLSTFTNYQYNNQGQLHTVVSNFESYAFVYDEQHRLKIVVNNQSANKGIQYFYSPAGKLLKQVNNAQVAFNYAYDDAGRLTGIQGVRADSIQYVYETSGRLKYVLYPNGMKMHYSYYLDGSINNISIKRQEEGKPEKVVSQLIYDYDDHGQLTRKTHQVPNGKTITDFYSYDGLGRLIKVEGPDNNLKYQLSYDPFGNRRYFETAKEKHFYTHNALHQVLKIQKDSADGELIRQFTYDKNGNLTEKKSGENVLTFNYNALDQLVKSSFNDRWLTQYLYDHAGQRVIRAIHISENQQDIQRYFYSGNQIHGVYDQNWQSKGFYAYAGLDSPVMKILPRNTFFFHQDALGSVVAYTDINGELDSWAAYQPWGELLAGSQSINSMFGFAAREPEITGLIYFRNRYYDPEIGRFTQADPMGFVDGVNRYAYVMNNPVMNVDPWGTWTKGAATNMTGWSYFGQGMELAGNLFLDEFMKESRPGTWGDFTVGALKKGYQMANDMYALTPQGMMAGSVMPDVQITPQERNGAQTLQALTLFGGVAKLGQATLSKASSRLASKLASHKSFLKKCTCCFAAGTPVLTENGHQAIETVEVGQKVYSKNPETGEVALKPVTDRILTEGKPLYSLVLQNTEGKEETIEVTDNHPFWVKGKGWVDSAKLTPGMVVEAYQNKALKVISLTPLHRIEDTYNLTVADFNTYFAGEQQAFVHNMNCPCNFTKKLTDLPFSSSDLKLTDAMNDKQFTKLVKDIRANGIENPVIKYVEIEGVPYVVHGNNRLSAAKYLGKTDQLEFQKVGFPVEGTNFNSIEDVLSTIGAIRQPKYRGR
ncbi:RHS repeat-associated core domain-containing protein [Spartinivicinus ruber]|uniref:RHS repeat-associated core domain-containing protein n=1 Tax=Spartinivicinus ruber TaxID=2683272 RepID=UPI0013D83BCE|nr:RHS repeat-associated core domain-containing protein [Spartinivicinus ruber]